MRALVVGPVTQYSTETAAWEAVSTLRLDSSYHTFRPEGQPETSRRPVPIDELTAGKLLAWKQEIAYAEPEDWFFASEKVQCRMPPWADTLFFSV